MSLKVSDPEKVAEAMIRAVQRGRATTGEAALMLGVTLPTIRARMDRRVLPYIQVGKRYFVPLDVLRQFGVVLPPLTIVHKAAGKKSSGVKTLLDFTSKIDSNIEDVGAYYE